MASSKLFIVLAMAAIIVPSTLATDHVVGDETGWTINFDYKAWAEGKVFRVGDRLVFNYPRGAHNVIKADETSLQQCVKPNGVEVLTTGNDMITLATPGKKWYFCGVGKHCEFGNQKLALTVLAGGESPTPAPSSSDNTPSSAATARTASIYVGMMAVMVAVVALVIV